MEVVPRVSAFELLPERDDNSQNNGEVLQGDLVIRGHTIGLKEMTNHIVHERVGPREFPNVKAERPWESIFSEATQCGVDPWCNSATTGTGPACLH